MAPEAGNEYRVPVAVLAAVPENSPKPLFLHHLRYLSGAVNALNRSMFAGRERISCTLAVLATVPENSPTTLFYVTFDTLFGR